jgi:hypothetical protein
MFCLRTLISRNLRSRINLIYFSLMILCFIALTANDSRFFIYAQSSETTNKVNASNDEFKSSPFRKPQNWSVNSVKAFNFENFLQNISPVSKNKASSLNMADETPHWLVGSYYSIEDGLTATLMLNNKGIAPLIVQPTLYSKDGQQLNLPQVVVDASSARYINLNDWIAMGGANFREGNIRLYHTGKELVLGAQIYLVDETNSLSFEEKLAELGKFDSKRLEGIWAIPSRQAKVKIVLTNTSGDSLTVNARVTRKPYNSNAPQDFVLAPHETRTLDLERDFDEGEKAIKSEAVALLLAHTGAKWALIARAFISEESTGYSNLSQFYNPLTGLMQEYQGTGIQMRSPGGERLKPVIVLRNTGSEKATVRTEIPYTRANGTNGSVTLPTTQLNPNEITLLNTNALEQRNNQENIKFSGVEIKYDAPAGSVSAAVHSESQNRNFVSRVPLWDPFKQNTATGGYPWLIEGTSVTKNYIKNITDRPQKYVAFFIWENNGMYMIGQKQLAAHQTVEIDVKDLRDRQVPDENGNTIPRHVSRGQFQWTLKMEENANPDVDPIVELALLGRSEQIDWGRKVSNNYSCQNCCMGSTVGSYLSPDQATVEVNGTVTIRAYLEEETCFGYPYSQQTSATWVANDTNVATVSGGNVSGVNIGNTTVTAYYHGPRYISNPPCAPSGPYLAGCDEDSENTDKGLVKQGDENKEDSPQSRPGCGQCFSTTYYQAVETASITVVGTPQISEIAPAGLAPSPQQVQVRIVGGPFGQNPTINVSGTGVTATLDAITPDGLNAWFTVAENAPVGQRQVTVTAGGRTSNALPFTIGDRSPLITSISRSQASAGETFSVTINGQYFGLNPLITFSQPGMSYAINSATTTQINATFTVASNTNPGPRTVRVVSRGINGTGFTQVPQQSDTSNGVPIEINVPQPSITDVGFVEKNSLKDITLSFAAGGAPSSTDTVKLKIEKTAGTGSATFESGYSEATYTGTSGTQQIFKIKGVTESSQANNFKVKVEVNGSTDGQPTRDFTVVVISSLEFERINADDIALDNNPGTNGIHTPEEGLRIYPDKNLPGENTDRSTLRVKATVSPGSVPNLKVYFSSFDLDDPSDDAAPIDSNAANGNDNNGAVNSSKSGELSNPASGGSCSGASISANVSKIECTLSGTATTANFKTTMNPGDNFAIAASVVEEYRTQIHINTSAGANLINNANQVIPISGEANSSNVQGIRTKMLTAWRKLHIEVDSMGSIGTGNNLTGMITNTVVIPGSNGTAVANVNIALEPERFSLFGRLFDGTNYYLVQSNTANTVTLVNTGKTALTINANTNFTLYDDDDYNADDTTINIGQITRYEVNGDNNEQFVQLPDSLKYLSAGDGVHTNGTLRNIYSSAYIMPEYVWAGIFNQTNLGLNLNIESGVNAANYLAVLNANRGSSGFESNEFWVAYILFAYQGPVLEDFDGAHPTLPNNAENALQGISSGQFIIGSEIPPCDCYDSSSCPAGARACVHPTNGTPLLPRGDLGSFIFQEVNQDLTRFFKVFAPQTSWRNIEEITITVPHEVGHQFGIYGDQKRTTFSIMDYSNYIANIVNDIGLHPEHINILRRRVKSPGQ